jgi:RNA polymerase sigma-70 factor (ECF subfamily)
MALGTARFSTTHWSVVVAAGGRHGPLSRESLAALCEMYWRPVYAYIVRRGVSPEEARDLTQEFFLVFLEKNFAGTADQHRGRFRSFLLAAVKHFLSNAWDKEHARKRGGGITMLPLEWQDDDRRFRHEPLTDTTPERLFEHRWALSVVERALAQLTAEHQDAGKADVFACLRPFLTDDDGADQYREAVRALDSTPGAVRVAVHRLRRRFRTILLEQVSQTVADPADIDAELRYLAIALNPPLGTLEDCDA